MNKCSVDGCKKKMHAKGMCSTHYGQARTASLDSRSLARLNRQKRAAWKRWKMKNDTRNYAP